MFQRLMIGLIAAALLVACGTATPAEQTATARQECAALATTYHETLTPIVQRWDDASKLAGQTGRGQLSGRISELQSIKRETDNATVPECMKLAHSHLVTSMNESIDGYIAFMGQKPEGTVNSHMAQSNAEMETWTRLVVDATVGLDTP